MNKIILLIFLEVCLMLFGPIVGYLAGIPYDKVNLYIVCGMPILPFVFLALDFFSSFGKSDREQKEA